MISLGPKAGQRPTPFGQMVEVVLTAVGDSTRLVIEGRGETIDGRGEPIDLGARWEPLLGTYQHLATGLG